MRTIDENDDAFRRHLSLLQNKRFQDNRAFQEALAEHELICVAG